MAIALFLVIGCTSSAPRIASKPAVDGAGLLTPAPADWSPIPTQSPAPLGPAGPVDRAEMLGPRHGYLIQALSMNPGAWSRLLVTFDGGSTWQDTTPPAAKPYLESLAVVGSTAWLSSWDINSFEVDVQRSVDGMRTWQLVDRAAHGFHGGSGSWLSFVSPTTGWLSTWDPVDQGGWGLARSADGGNTWANRLQHTDPGPASFWTAADGWMAGVISQRPLRLTHDGGRTWTTAALPVPTRYRWDEFAPVPAYSVLSVKFFSALHGVVAVALHRSDGGFDLGLYSTVDGGHSWGLVSTLPRIAAEPQADDFRPIATVALISSSDVWVLTNGLRPRLWLTTDLGRSWSPTATVGLPSAGALSTVDGVHAWALTRRSGGLLYATSDGGATWRLLAV